MGKKRYHNVSATRVIEDDMVPDPFKTAIIEAALLDLEVDVTLEDKFINGAFLKFDKFYKYAAEGNYILGLPDTKVVGPYDGNPLVESTIEGELGTAVTMVYAFCGTYNNIHLAYKDLIENYGFNEESNELETLSTEKGFPVYLDNIIPHFEGYYGDGNDTRNNSYWGRNPREGYTPIRTGAFSNTEIADQINYDAVYGIDITEGAEVSYIWMDDAKEIHIETFFIDLSTYDKDASYYQAKYINVGTGEIGYWIYQQGLGTFPALDSVYELTGQAPYMTSGSYFPIVPFREFWTDYTDGSFDETEGYISIVGLLKNLDMDYAAIGAAIHENPDIDKVVQANMFMGVPVMSEDQADRAYIFAFFKQLEQASPSLSGGDEDSAYKLGFTFEYYDAGFHASITYVRIARRIVAGNIGQVGYYDSTYSVQEFYTDEVEYRAGGLRYRQEDRIDFKFRKQISNGLVEEIVVDDAIMRYWVGSLAFNAPVNIPSPIEAFLIPIDKNLTSLLDYRQRQRLYYRSLHFVFMSELTVETEWYESSAFKFVLTVAAVALTVLFPPAALVNAWGQGFIAFAVAVAQTIAAGVVINLALEALIKEIGVEAGLIVAIVALAVGGYKGFTASSIGQEAWAGNLIAASSGLVNASNAVLGDMYSELQSDIARTLVTQEKLMEELQEKMDLLSNRSGIDPMVFEVMVPLTVFGETGSQMVNRTAGNPNPGTLCFDLVKNFVSNSLRLPNINDTFGDVL